MSITVVRRTGLIGTILKMTIKINGERVAKIANGQKLEMVIPNNVVQICVTQSGVKSNTIEVKDGERVQIKSNKWSNRIYVLYYIIFITGLFTSNSLYKSIALLVILLLGFILLFIVNAFQLTILDDETYLICIINQPNDPNFSTWLFRAEQENLNDYINTAKKLKNINGAESMAIYHCYAQELGQMPADSATLPGIGARGYHSALYELNKKYGVILGKKNFRLLKEIPL